MLSLSVRRRLERLNRQSLGLSDHSDVKPASDSGLGKPSPHQFTSIPRLRYDDGEIVEQSAGAHLRFRMPLAKVWPGVERHLGNNGAAVNAIDRGETGQDAEVDAFAAAFPQHALFADLETCGFAGSAIFLVGLVRLVGGLFVVELLFARSYAEEAAMLQSLWQAAGECRVLVTFNGKSFDWPTVCDRSTIHRVGGHGGAEARIDLKKSDGWGGPSKQHPMTTPNGDLELVQFDLLHHARRRWKRMLPDCKLKTLERFVCGRSRVGDPPSGEIPALYHQYVRHRKWSVIESILRHNVEDLVTLFDLALRMTNPIPKASAPRP